MNLLLVLVALATASAFSDTTALNVQVRYILQEK